MNDLHIHTNVQPRSCTPVLTAAHTRGPLTVAVISVKKSWDVQRYVASQTWAGIKRGDVGWEWLDVTQSLVTVTGIF